MTSSVFALGVKTKSGTPTSASFDDFYRSFGIMRVDDKVWADAIDGRNSKTVFRTVNNRDDSHASKTCDLFRDVCAGRASTPHNKKVSRFGTLAFGDIAQTLFSYIAR